jgi:hypothetical protein
MAKLILKAYYKMRVIFFTIFTLFMTVAPGYSVNWEFVTSEKTDDGIDISYFIDADEIKIRNEIRSYTEKRVYTKGKSAKNIGMVQITGYYDCANGNNVNGSIAFLSPEGKYLKGYLLTGDDYMWQNISPGPSSLIYDYVCRFNNP